MYVAVIQIYYSRKRSLPIKESKLYRNYETMYLGLKFDLRLKNVTKLYFQINNAICNYSAKSLDLKSRRQF